MIPRRAGSGQPIDPNSGPAAIAVGDGATWLTDSEANNVTRVDPTGLSTPIAVGNGPTGIAVSADGVWVADSLDDTVKRIDPAAQSVVDHDPGRSLPCGGRRRRRLGLGGQQRRRHDQPDRPRTNKVIATITVGGSPQAITIADGRVWVTVDSANDQTDLAPRRRHAPDRVSTRSRTPSTRRLRTQRHDSWQVLYATCAKLLNYPDKPGPAARS